MDKPFCKVCKHRHYAWEEHVWDEREGSRVDDVAVSGSRLTKQPVTSGVPAAVATTTLKGKFNRVEYQKEYMREYMRKWRERKRQE